MAAVTPGAVAPDFSLISMDGAKFSLQNALAKGPVIVAFFKVSCPVCQYTFPFLERLYKNISDHKVSLIGISQNDRNATADFTEEYGVTFPVLLDDTKAFLVSNAYGLTTVPTIFWIAEDGTIQISSVGWSRKDFEEIAGKVAELVGGPSRILFCPDEKIAEFRAG